MRPESRHADRTLKGVAIGLIALATLTAFTSAPSPVRPTSGPVPPEAEPVEI